MKNTFARLCNWTQYEWTSTDADSFYTFLEADCCRYLLASSFISAPISWCSFCFNNSIDDLSVCLCVAKECLQQFLIIRGFKWCRATSRRVFVQINDKSDYVRLKEGGRVYKSIAFNEKKSKAGLDMTWSDNVEELKILASLFTRHTWHNF